MNTILLMLITWLRAYGYPALWLCVSVAAFGLPLPGFLLLLAAGAFAALGDFNVLLLIPIALSASLSGDTVGYIVGRRLENLLLIWSGHKQHPPVRFLQKVQEAQHYFSRRAAWAIFLSRFLFLPLGGPINLLAGASRYPYRRFLLYDFSGQLLGTLIPLSLGYFFGEGWESLSTLFNILSLIALVLLVAAFITLRLLKRVRQPVQPLPIPLLPQMAGSNVALQDTEVVRQDSGKSVLP